MQRRDPPHNLEVERSVIGACLLDPNALHRIENLSPADFYSRTNRILYEQIRDALEDEGAIDPVTLAERLERNGDLEDVGGLAAITELFENTPSAANVRNYARIVRDKSKERALLAVLADIEERMGGTESLPEKLDFAQAQIMSLTAQSSQQAVRISSLRDAFIQTMRQRAGGAASGLHTGFRDLDARLRGLKPGNLVILAARPAMGKSSLAGQIAANVARAGDGIVLFSLEMSADELHDRIVAWESGLPLSEITTGRPSAPSCVSAALERMGSWPFEVDDSGGLSVREVRARARAAARRMSLKLVVVDYLQLMVGEGDTRNAQIESVSRGLKALAKELAVPVVALSQLSRECERRADHRPILADLRDSGGIEQDADIVLMLHREEIYRQSPGEWSGLAEVLIRKNRQGPTGDVRLAWRAAHAAFDSFDGHWPEVGAGPFRRSQGFDA